MHRHMYGPMYSCDTVVQKYYINFSQRLIENKLNVDPYLVMNIIDRFIQETYKGER